MKPERTQSIPKTKPKGWRVPPHAFKKGQSGNPKGRPKGAANKLTEHKIRLIANTGMMPLDFMTAVYRDQLFDDYDQKIAEDGVTMYFVPKPDAKKIDVTLQQRIICATNAAPYVHKKQPVGIEMGDKGRRTITADAIAKMSTEQIENLLAMMEALGLTPEFEGFESRSPSMQQLDAPEGQ